MKALVLVLIATISTSFGQGQVVFANRVGAAGLDAPVFIPGTQNGPGPNFSAQLYLLSAGGGALTALTPASTFFASTPSAPTRDRYWEARTVDVPGIAPGNNATFIVRAWRTSDGTFEQAEVGGGTWGQSLPFVVAVGGGTLPPANLTTLQSFSLIPEPSVIALGLFGASAFILRRRR